MKRLGLLLFLTAAACHRDRDLRICEYNPGYCADADTDSDVLTADGASEAATDSLVADSEPDAIEPDSAIDSFVADADSDSLPSDTGSDADAAADSTTVDSAPETAVDSAPVDTGPTDTCTCTPGEVVSVTGTCFGALEKKTRTCTSSCTWGPDVCAVPRGWTKIADPPSGFEGRLFPAFASTSGELIVHGGQSSVEGGSYFSDGAIYSLAKNAWSLLPASGAPSARGMHTAVWTGTDFVVWGGANATTYFADGARYDAFAKNWQPLPTSPLSARSLHGAAWVPGRNEMIIWGGRSTSGGHLADGAVLSLDTGTWAPLPTAPIAARSGHVMRWTGSEVLVWGGAGASRRLNDGALFDPAKKTWRAIPAAPVAGRLFPSTAASMDRFAFFGGLDPTTDNDGAILDLTALTWTTISAPPATMFPPRSLPAAWQSGSRIYMWSGASTADAGISLLPSGAALDTASVTWSALAETDSPLPRTYATAAAFSVGGIVWSGVGQPSGGILETLRDGALFVP